MSEEENSQKGFTNLHDNDKNIYEILHNIGNLPMHMSLRSRLFAMMKDYDNYLVKLCDESVSLSEAEEQMLREGNFIGCVKSYGEVVNLPFHIAKKVISLKSKNLGIEKPI